jgi:hypothetical protein
MFRAMTTGYGLDQKCKGDAQLLSGEEKKTVGGFDPATREVKVIVGGSGMGGLALHCLTVLES